MLTSTVVDSLLSERKDTKLRCVMLHSCVVCFFCSDNGYTVGQEEIITLEIKPTSHTGVLLSSSSAKGDYIVLEMIFGNVSITCELHLLWADEELFS